MEDWQNSSFEEKVDLDNLVLFPPESYPISGISELRSGIKEELSEEDADVIENPSHNDIKTESVEVVEQASDTRNFEFSRNGAEICQTCGLEFGNKVVLKIHNSLLHLEENKDDQDIDLERNDEVVQEYETAKSDHLKTHIKLVHEGNKWFKCNLCEYETVQKSTLDRHKISVHEGIKTGIKAFKCNMCEFETAQKSNLNRHKISVHEGIKPFKCSFCDFKAARKTTLKQHIKGVHEGIKRNGDARILK